MPELDITLDTSKAPNKVEENFSTPPVNQESYRPTEKQAEVLNRVYTRFYDFRDNPSRKEAEQDWVNGDRAYRATVDPLPDDDDRTNLNLDPSFGIIETINQETIERNARPYFVPFEDSDKAVVSLINDVGRSSFEIGNFDREYQVMKKERDIRGTAILMDFYRYETRWVKELEVKKDPKTGEFIETYVEREIVDWDDVYAMWRPLNEYYFDGACLHVDQAIDMVWREILHINKFKRKYGKRRGFFDVDKVTVGGFKDEDSQFEVPKDKMGANDVEVIHYYNRETDEYVVCTNGVLNRNGPIPLPHKELPVSVFYCYKDPQRFYGLGIPKIVEQEAAELTTNRNLRLDYIKRAVQKMFFISDLADVDEFDLIPRPHGLIEVNTQGQRITDVVAPMEYGDVKVSSYQDEELLYEQVRRKTGIDDRVQGVNVGGTATEAAILKEASQKRINAQTLFNEIDGLTRLGRLRWANIVFFYSVPRIKRIVEKNGKWKAETETREVRIKGKQYMFDQEGNLQLEDKEGYSSLKMTKSVMKYLNTNVDVTVDTKEGQTISKPIKQAKMTEMLDRLLLPASLPFVNVEKTLKWYVEGNDADPTELLKDKANAPDPHELAEAEFEVMLAGVPLPPTPDATEDHVLHEVALTRGTRFQAAPENIQDAITTHIAGEDAQLRAQAGPQQSVSQGGDVSGTPAALPRPNQNPADIEANNINAPV